jgi:SWI/SNF-related matrix-associated actin-dependent regulator 1 of chromatin subfamily A
MENIEKISEVYKILSEYEGDNPYILTLKYKNKALNNFEINFIEKSHNFKPILINKVVKMSESFSKKRKEDWNLDFLPENIYIGHIIGETDNAYCAYIKYSKRQTELKMTFIYKNDILTPLFSNDLNKIDIDFSRYDEILKKINPNFSVMEHQKNAIKFLLDRKKCILALEQGLGKSLCSIVGAEESKVNKILIICPASLKTNWKNEIKRFSDEKNISLIKSIDEMNREDLLKHLQIKEEVDIKTSELRNIAKAKGKWNEGKKYTIINYDILEEFHQLPKSRKKVDIEDAIKNSDLLESNFDLVIIDEAHRLSNSTSTRYKIVRDFLSKNNNKYTWLLTGTPITNKPMNFYHVLRLIENEITKDYNYYTKRYCEGEKILKKGEWDRCWNIWNKGKFSSYQSMDYRDKKIFRDYIEKYGKHINLTGGASNLDELKERVSHLYFRLVKDDVPGMVKKQINPIFYELSIEQQKEYDKLWDEYVKEQEELGKDVTDLKSLIEGGVYRQYISKIMLPNTIKMVEDFIEEGEKVFVICCYDDEVYKLKEYFGDKAVIYNGKMNIAQKDKSVDEFNNNPNIKVFIGNLQASSVGINLNKSCNIALFQNFSFVPGEFEQACDRVHRIGSQNDVDIYIQVFKDTIYERMYEVINNKSNIINQIIKKENEK